MRKSQNIIFALVCFFLLHLQLWVWPVSAATTGTDSLGAANVANVPSNSLRDSRKTNEHLVSQITLLPLNYRGVYVSNVSARVHSGPRHWTMELRQSGFRFGSHVGSAGDINGDGYSDIFVGASRFNNQMHSSGRVFVFHGSSNALAHLPNWVRDGTRPEARFGHSTAGVGDVDGDGFDDLLVGAPRQEARGRNDGHAFLFQGSASGLSDSFVWEAKSPQEGSAFAQEVASAGDVNHDGFADVIVGCQDYTASFPKEGAAFLFLGTSNGLSRVAAWTNCGGFPNAAFGDSAAGVGDVDGDGFDDVLVGASLCKVNGESSGRVALFFGSTNGLSRRPDWTYDGPEQHGRLGAAVARAGDVNRDGYADFFVSAPGGRSRTNWPGTVFLFLGSPRGPGSAPVWSASGTQRGCQFGWSVSTAGDVNGDGLPDTIIGAPAFSATWMNEGRVFLYLGRTNGLSDQPDWIADGGQPGAQFGFALAGAGDINRDGLADFIVGSPYYPFFDGRSVTVGRADVFFGGRTGFAKGEIFPCDGTNAIAGKPKPLLASVSPVVIDSWPLGRFVLSAAAGLLLAGALSWLWLKKRHAFVAERERARIAKDLHDDLGARLTRISMLTELVRRQSTQTEEGGRHAQLLAESAKEALNDMEQAIWSVSPSTDTLEHLVTFILQYAEPFLAPTGIEWNAAAPVELPNRKLQAELRRNIFLAVKEALHNVVKHSRARNAHLRITFDDPWLTVIVEDDGRGLPRDADRAGGDGLKNMRQRMAASGGRFSVECRTEGGTCVTLRAKL